MGMRIVVEELKSATIDTHGDHRVAMSFHLQVYLQEWNWGYRVCKYLFSKLFWYIERDYRYWVWGL